MDNEAAQRKKQAIAAAVAALMGVIGYGIEQAGTKSVLLGAFFELFYRLCIYIFMPFTFSALPVAIVEYAYKRYDGSAEMDLTGMSLLLLSAAFAFYITAPVIGDITIVKATAVFLLVRIVRRFV